MTDKDVAAKLAENAERLRVKAGWSKAELARRMKTNQSNVGRMLEGYYSPSAKTLAAVATAFGVELCELLCEPKRKK